ncbi:hypothetical protein SUGI_0736030 [Cryptomeria japonica]|uniref:alcohol acyltransferase 9 n=1 Tax=Cryptomeria japonica TaxID=3369 RepID=UPI00241480DC|nr:alcohol acyltransferase 9 [Cryptomeria japonica]GLJ36605.1 hypothetical protein SUGI_0736030 [Cryptomeria japonica]
MLLPDLQTRTQAPVLVPPSLPTPFECLYLSNLDDQLFLRFSIKYLFLYHRKDNDKENDGDAGERIKTALGRVLVYYYPLAGRLRRSEKEPDKLEVVCNGEGALFVQAHSDLTLQEFQRLPKPCKSWRKLLHKVQADSFVDIPPLVVQVTELKGGGVVVCVAISHCLCDGLGSSQFVHTWAQIARKATDMDPFPLPYWGRELLRPRNPLQIQYSHPEFRPVPDLCNLKSRLSSDTLVRTSLRFTGDQLSALKRTVCNDKDGTTCTSFEAISSHIWRCWIRAMGLPGGQSIKLLFSANVRHKLQPQLPAGFYGNAFVLACAESTVDELTERPLSYAVQLLQKAKARLSDDYVRSVIDYLADKSVRPDMVASLVISQWSRMELMEVDFGWGKPLHAGPLASDIYCLLLPSSSAPNAALDVLLSLPESVLHRYAFYMRSISDFAPKSP